MVSLSNHEGPARAAVRDRFMVRQAHHEAVSTVGAGNQSLDRMTLRTTG